MKEYIRRGLIELEDENYDKFRLRSLNEKINDNFIKLAKLDSDKALIEYQIEEFKDMLDGYKTGDLKNYFDTTTNLTILREKMKKIEDKILNIEMEQRQCENEICQIPGYFNQADTEGYTEPVEMLEEETEQESVRRNLEMINSVAEYASICGISIEEAKSIILEVYENSEESLGYSKTLIKKGK